MARLSPIATDVGSTGVGVVSEEGEMSSEMGATAHAEGMMGSALEHEPAGWDMILDMILGLQTW